jgi:hypothetical protein
VADRLAPLRRKGDDISYTIVTIPDSAGEPADQAVLTRRQANELAAWRASVASTTSAPLAMAGELRRWIDPAPATPAVTVVFAKAYSRAAYPVPLGAVDADRFATTLELGIRQRELIRTVIREQSPYQRGQRVRVRENGGGAPAGRPGHPLPFDHPPALSPIRPCCTEPLTHGRATTTHLRSESIAHA